MWHIHGYDKLKPIGFPIHGAIDGFSRKILWLNICPSNNDPYIISYFYVNCISNLKCVQRTIRGIGAVKMLLWMVCSSILEENIKTPCLDIQIFYSEAVQTISE